MGVSRVDRCLIGDLNADVIETDGLDDLLDLRFAGRLFGKVAYRLAHNTIFQKDLITTFSEQFLHVLHNPLDIKAPAARPRAVALLMLLADFAPQLKTEVARIL